MPHETCCRQSISTIKKDEWGTFLQWAKQEDWRVPAQELQIYQGPLSDSAYVMREGRKPLGFVTIARHERSGWIGNLLVSPERRREGIGMRLFEHAMRTLKDRGARTIWLTASREGQPLYNRYGFAEVDRIERWVHSGPYGMTIDIAGDGDHDLLFSLDKSTWGESRFWLLAHLSQKGRVLTFGQTSAMLQEGTNRHIVGPWLSAQHCPLESRQLISQILAAAGRDTEIVIDVIGSSPNRSLLAAAGFGKVGSTGLMAHGPRTGFHKERLVALASLGSMG